MENSAFNHHNETPENFAFFDLSNSSCNSDYGIYNSTGQILKGSKLFEQYTELATQLDTKRSAFYLESKDNEIIFGCSLSVKADSGREERVVFIQVYKNLPSQYETNLDIESLKKFYEMIKFEVENLNVKKYQLVGLWDGEDFRNLKITPIEIDVLEYTTGKISSHKKVFVKVSELSTGLSFILELITILGHRITFILDVSQYPSESDVSVSLIKPNPDFELGENGVSRILTEPRLWNFYKDLGEEFSKNSYLKGSQTQPDSVSPTVKKILSDPLYYCISCNSVIDNFDDREKVEMFQAIIQKVTDLNDPNIRRVLIAIFRKIESSECRKALYNILISRNIYIEEVLKDLVTTIYREHNKDLFNLLFKKNSWENSSYQNRDNEWTENFKKESRYNSFEKEVKKALKPFEYSDKLNFVKFIAIEAPSKPKTEGMILLKILIEDLVYQKGNNDFVFKLSEEEAENLDKIQGSNYAYLKKRKKNRNIKTIFCAGALIVILLISFSLMCYINSAEKGQENNSSGNNTKNHFTLCNYLTYLNGFCENIIQKIPGNLFLLQVDEGVREQAKNY